MSLFVKPGETVEQRAHETLEQFVLRIEKAAVLRSLVADLVRAVLLFEARGFAPFQAAFEARDVLRGRDVVLSDGMAGSAAGVDVSGALLVHTSLGMKVITSAEVSVRPVGTNVSATGS